MTISSTVESLRLQAGRARDAVRVPPRRNRADRPLPDFVILGVQKAGTSSLYARLTAHPAVPRSGRRCTTSTPGRPIGRITTVRSSRRRASVRAVERDLGSPVITGEATPYYLSHPAAPGTRDRWYPTRG